MNDHIVQGLEVTRFEMTGWVSSRCSSSGIRLDGTDRYIESWPPTVMLLGHKYVLDEVVRNSPNPIDGERLECAKYI